MTAPKEHGGTDLGRRIVEQRRRAGLSRDETARRAGMAATYLRYLETSTNPSVTSAAVSRLADVLGVSAATLAGAGLESPPGGQPPAHRPVPQQLNAAQCSGYLSAGGIGRIVIAGPRGPEAIPVNYAVLQGDIVVRTSRSVAERTAQPLVSFEVDRLDEALAEGWSVLATGTAHVVSAAAELAAVRSLGLQPWAGGERDAYLRITIDKLTGRRIRAGT